MAWLASLPGRLLERFGNGSPRGMAATQPGTPGCAQNPAYRATFHLISYCLRIATPKMGGDFSLGRRKNIFVDNFVGFLHEAL